MSASVGIVDIDYTWPKKPCEEGYRLLSKERLWSASCRIPKADWAPRVFRAKTTLQGLSLNGIEAYCNSVSMLKPGLRQSLYSTEFKAQLDGYRAVEVFKRHAAKLTSNDPLATIQYLDMKTYLVGDINTKVDRASMAHSLEVREPLMDHHLVEWMARIPSKFKIVGKQGKWLLKKSLERCSRRIFSIDPRWAFHSAIALVSRSAQRTPAGAAAR